MSGKVRTTWISDDIGTCPEKKVWNSVSGKYRTGLHLFIEIYRVGDDRKPVNSSSPHISDQLGTENVWETLLCWFIVVLRVLLCKNMYQHERHFGSSTGTRHCSCFRLRNRTYRGWQSERHKDIIVGTHTWHQCSVTISEDILSTKYDLNLR